jgi:peptidoglycan/LPS O-acetylase OafA/YrhL
VRLADRLRALDEQVVWREPSPRRLRLTPGLALAVGLVAICVYVGWAASWGWPRALVAVVGLVLVLAAVARFWFAPPAASDAERRPRVSGARVGQDVDEVRRTGVEATT